MTEESTWKSPWRKVLVHVTFELDGLIGQETVELHPHFPREDPVWVLFRAAACFGSHLTRAQGRRVRIRRIQMEQP